jgi:macrodomain Ter protein organizer (MatP/YcbG family)
VRKGEKIEYNPEIHCGAAKKNGEPCTNIKGFGTDHPKEGRCKYHKGNNKGATTPEGKERVREASIAANSQPRTNGARKLKADLLGERLVGKTKVTYEQVRQNCPVDLISQMVSAFYASVIDSYASAQNGTRQAWFLNDRKVIEMATLMCEEGQIDEEYLMKLRLKLMGYDDKSWGALVSQATALLERAEQISKMDSQMSLMKNFLTQVLSMQDERTTQLGVGLLKQLVVDSGFPVAECDRILADARANNAMRSVNTEVIDMD